MKYYISRAGKTYGPYALTDIRTMAAQGNLSADDMAWSEGMSSWTPVHQVLGNLGAAPLPPPHGPSVPSPAAQPPAWNPASPGASLGGPAFLPEAPPQTQSAPAVGPVPPGLHWAALVGLTIVTCGVFSVIWLFVQASFLKRIDPKSHATLFYGLYIAGYLLGALLASTAGGAAAIGGLLMLVAVGFAIAGSFSIKGSLEEYYSAEPVRLRLSGGMTIFFNVFYFQYHLARITKWRRTGVLV